MSAPDLGEPHRLILVRHGATHHTVEQRFSGAGYRPEPQLAEIGRQQAAAAAEHLAQFGPIDDLLCSPLLRARQTAAVIAERLGLPGAVVDPAWSEADFGRWEGSTLAEVLEHSPEAVQQVWDNPSAMPPGGESRTQVGTRVSRRWAGLARAGRTSMVVTHLTPIRAVVAEALQLPESAFHRVIAGPGTITVVDRWSDGGAALLVLGERPRPGLE